jgi:hypothetical protein
MRPLLLLICLLTLAGRCVGQTEPDEAAEPVLPAIAAADFNRPTLPVHIDTQRARVKTIDGASVYLLDGPLTIQIGPTTLTATQAVLWSRVLPGGEGRRRLDGVLLGDVVSTGPNGERRGSFLPFNAIAAEPPTLLADERSPDFDEAEPAYIEARQRLANRQDATPVALDPATQSDDLDEAEADGDSGLLPPLPLAALQAGSLATVPTDDGSLAATITGGLFLIRGDDDGGLIELRADRGVVFIAAERLDDLAALAPEQLARSATGVYLEGGVSVVYTEPDPRGGIAREDQRLRADRAFYDLSTDRAILTDAVLHATAGGFDRQPLTVRARTLRRLADGDYEARGAEVSTSRFKTPMLSLNASRVFVRDNDDTRVIDRSFGADNVTARAFGVPVFYFPVIRAGTVDYQVPLRSIGIGNTRNKGQFLRTEWGLLETFGIEPRPGFDATYSLDYFTERGLLGGIDLGYAGRRFLNVDDGRSTGFAGRLQLEGIDDFGIDDLPGRRFDVDQGGLRGRVTFEHEQFLLNDAAYGGDDYALFARFGLVSDETYLEEWDRRRFNLGEPQDFSVTVVNRSGNALAAAKLDVGLLSFPTTAEQFPEPAAVNRLPELTAGSYGDRLGWATITSEASLGLFSFDNFSFDPQADFGLREGDLGFTGIPTYAYTGTSEQVIGRADLRQVAALPVQIGALRIRPYVVGRFTAYSESPTGGSEARALGGFGVYAATTIARVDDSVFSRILGIDRIRHLVEPHVHAFGSLARGPDPTELYQFDQLVDGYGQLGVLHTGVRQRFQTYRGPPGNKRSVDWLEIEATATLFDAAAGVEQRAALRFADAPDFDGLDGPFRGVFFEGRPEASLPLDVADLRGRMRLSSATTAEGRVTYGLDADEILSTAGEVEFDRGDRVQVGLNALYLRPADATILGGRARYRLSDKYRLDGASQVDIDEGRLRNSQVTVTRFFNRATLRVGFYLDNIDDEQGIRFQFTPSDTPVVSFDNASFQTRN